MVVVRTVLTKMESARHPSVISVLTSNAFHVKLMKHAIPTHVGQEPLTSELYANVIQVMHVMRKRRPVSHAWNSAKLVITPTCVIPVKQGTFHTAKTYMANLDPSVFPAVQQEQSYTMASAISMSA